MPQHGYRQSTLDEFTKINSSGRRINQESEKSETSSEEDYNVNIFEPIVVIKEDAPFPSNTFEEEDVFRCKYCQKYFSNVVELKQHERKHTGKPANICKTCNKTFSSTGNLNRHINRIHLNNRHHQCEICNRQFRNVKELKSHQIVHSQDIKQNNNNDNYFMSIPLY